MECGQLITFHSEALLWFFLMNIYKDVNELKLVLLAWTFAKRLRVNNILRWC